MSFEIIFRNLLGDTEESHKNLRKDWEILVPRIETWISRIRKNATSRRTTLRTALSRAGGLSLRKAKKKRQSDQLRLISLSVMNYLIAVCINFKVN